MVFGDWAGHLGFHGGDGGDPVCGVSRPASLMHVSISARYKREEAAASDMASRCRVHGPHGSRMRLLPLFEQQQGEQTASFVTALVWH